ncbi:carcinoembryonic antigen-related cell adhesion molecule 5-like isoform X3 [Clupea harengus]|uniref:Carcinoembryonic antigen-related cell adhesion molecule 5-like isoform X3 n=1 Tax=Clupea harengus TaxID=7950 RepID=A0A6P8GBM8_CLUHA|nr:carcinoembryonic antigen-related cell adhesion molecule 5-like isoform X3 [Clupea harengus]
MDSHALLTVGILSAIGFCSCKNELLLNGPLDGAVGGSVEFTLINPPSPPPNLITWRFTGYTENIIVNSFSGGNETHVDYVGRISVNKTTASLKLRGLTHNDTGRYSVSFLISGVGYQGGTSLTVFDKISNVKAEANQHELVEFNSSVILTCSASGSYPSFRWFNRSADVTGSDNRTLTVVNVTRYDTGPFQCEASNAINVEMSSEVNLTIAYGPDSAVVTVKPPDSFYSSGSDITLSCSSESKPAAQFQWALNGTLLGREGPELRLENVQASQSGAYSCRAYNSKTHRSETSSPSTITVLERISGAAITSTGGVWIECKSSVILTCDAQGSIITREWRKDGNPLHGVNIDELNRTVSISPLKKEDKGYYTCQVSNPVSSETASKGLIVNCPLPPWVIVIIVIGVLIGVTAVIGISIFLLKKKGKLGLPMGRQAPQQNNASTTSAALPRAGLGNGVNVGEQNTEHQYDTIMLTSSSMSGPQAHSLKGQVSGKL